MRHRGFFAGYVASRLYKVRALTEWQRAVGGVKSLLAAITEYCTVLYKQIILADNWLRLVVSNISLFSQIFGMVD